MLSLPFNEAPSHAQLAVPPGVGSGAEHSFGLDAAPVSQASVSHVSQASFSQASVSQAGRFPACPSLACVALAAGCLAPLYVFYIALITFATLPCIVLPFVG